MKKILVVEDEPSTRVLLKKLINEIGYIEIAADSAELGLDILKVNKDIDLIISDVVLEGMSGLDLVKQVKQTNKLSKIPIIVCSGIISKEEIITFLKEDIELFFEKPLNGKKVQRHILKILEPVLEETFFK